MLRTAADGSCAFFDRGAGNLCSIQRTLGHDWLPAACRHFPRVTLLDQRGAFIALSHYCPTAARQLFRTDVVLEIVASPAMCSGRENEGFDARETCPPLLRPAVLFDRASLNAWERFAVATCAREDQSPEGVIALFGAAAESIRRWTAGAGALAEAVTALPATTAAVRADVPLDLPGLYAEALAAVPEDLAHPAPPDDLAAADARWVRPAWSKLARPIRYFLAAHAFGSWIAYQGEGVRTLVRSLAVALAVLRVEAIRASLMAGRVLDDELLLEAIRAADLLLVHLVSRDVLARRLSRIEATRIGGEPRV